MIKLSLLSRFALSSLALFSLLCGDGGNNRFFVLGQVYYTADESDWKTFDILTADSISLVCDVGNTNRDSNICNRSRYIEFWNWNLTYGIVPQNKLHTLYLNGCRFPAECEIECDPGCRCIVQSTGASCDGGLKPDGSGYLPAPTMAPTTAPPSPAPSAPAAAATGPVNHTDDFIVCAGDSAVITCNDDSLFDESHATGTTEIDPTMRACDFAEDLFPNWMVQSSLTDRTTSIILDTCLDGALCALKCHESCTCQMSDGGACNSCSDITYNSQFLVCGSASAVVTCPAAAATTSIEQCLFSTEDFSSSEYTDTVGGGFELSVTGCSQSRCAIGCIPTECTCIEPDDGSDCGQCDPYNQDPPPPPPSVAPVPSAAPSSDTSFVVNGDPVSHSLNFVSCPGATAIITCSGDPNLLAINATNQNVLPGYRACDFLEDNFADWMPTTSSLQNTTTLTLTDCLETDETGAAIPCAMQCHETCDCRTPDGGPCGFFCPNPTTAGGEPTVDYESSFLVCGSAAATISCPNVAAATADAAQCVFDTSLFDDAVQTISTENSSWLDLALTGCGQSRCPIACMPKGCTCIEPDDGSSCGSCNGVPPSPPPPPEETPTTTLNVTGVFIDYSLEFVSCADKTAVITCTDPTLIAIGQQQAEDQDISPLQRACDFAESQYSNWTIQTTSDSSILTLDTCGVEAGGLCAMSCHESCDCRTPDGQPCGFFCPDPDADPSSSQQQQVNYTNAFLVCGSAAATITCNDPSQLQVCDYLDSQFASGEVVSSSTNGGDYELALMGCGESRCAVGCRGPAASCTCIEPDDGSECGQCDPLNQERPVLEDTADRGIDVGSDENAIDYSLQFVSCSEKTAVITCTDPSLIAIGAQGQDVPLNQRACDFAEADFVDWMAMTTAQSSVLTLISCSNDGLCSMNCHESCDCRTPSGDPCGFFCQDPKNEAAQVNYTSGFHICGSASAKITCSGTAEDDLQVCDFLDTEFDNGNHSFKEGVGYELDLKGCGESRCAVGCKSETCTCFEPDDGSDCGQCELLNPQFVGNSEQPRTIGNSAGAGNDDFVPGGNTTFYSLNDATITCPSDTFCEYQTSYFVSADLTGKVTTFSDNGEQAHAAQISVSAKDDSSQVKFKRRDIFELTGCATGMSISTGAAAGGGGILNGNYGVAGSQSRRNDQEAPVSCEIVCSNTCACVTGDNTECTKEAADDLINNLKAKAAESAGTVAWPMNWNGGLVIIALFAGFILPVLVEGIFI